MDYYKISGPYGIDSFCFIDENSWELVNMWNIDRFEIDHSGYRETKSFNDSFEFIQGLEVEKYTQEEMDAVSKYEDETWNNIGEGQSHCIYDLLLVIDRDMNACSYEDREKDEIPDVFESINANAREGLEYLKDDKPDMGMIKLMFLRIKAFSGEKGDGSGKE